MKNTDFIIKKANNLPDFFKIHLKNFPGCGIINKIGI